MRKSTDLTKSAHMLAAFMVIVLIFSPLSVCTSEAGGQDAVIRLDDDGYLYYMNYTKDYYSPEVMDAMRKINYIDSGCSVFFTHNTEGECINCRNYDYPHRVSPEKDRGSLAVPELFKILRV